MDKLESKDRGEYLLQQAIALSVLQLQEYLKNAEKKLKDLESSPEELRKNRIVMESLKIPIKKKEVTIKVLSKLQGGTNLYDLVKELCSKEMARYLQEIEVECDTQEMGTVRGIAVHELCNAAADYLLVNKICDGSEASLLKADLSNYFFDFLSNVSIGELLQNETSDVRDASLKLLDARQEEADFRADVASHRKESYERHLASLNLTKAKQLYDQLQRACDPVILGFKLSIPNSRAAINISYNEITSLALQMFEACGEALEKMEDPLSFYNFHHILTHGDGHSADQEWLNENKLLSPDTEIAKMLTMIAGVRKMEKKLWEKIEKLFPHIYEPISDESEP